MTMSLLGKMPMMRAARILLNMAFNEAINERHEFSHYDAQCVRA